jgi:hypothetical protein
MPPIRAVFAWGVLAVLVLIGLGWAALFGLVVWSARGPHPAAVLARAEPVCEPIIVALKEYHKRHGRYPDALADLVKERLLAGIPELPPHWGTSARSGPTYEVSRTLDFYRLTFAYCVEGGIGPGDFHGREYVSDEHHGWGPSTATGIEDLIADRILRVYRKERDQRSLAVFMADVIGRADCEYLYRDRVEKWLGPGAEIVVPAGMEGAGRTGYVYHARRDVPESYCFVYKDHWLPDQTGARNYPVLDILIRVRELGDRPSCTVIRTCPASPRDRLAPLTGPSTTAPRRRASGDGS